MGYFLTQKYDLGTITADTQTRAIDLQNMSRTSFQLTQSADPVQWAATIQLSNDGENWTDSGSVDILTAGTALVTVSNIPTRYCRLALVKTSGDLEDLVVVFNGKF